MKELDRMAQESFKRQREREYSEGFKEGFMIAKYLAIGLINKSNQDPKDYLAEAVRQLGQGNVDESSN